MKSFIFNVVLFLGSVFILDQALGLGLRYLEMNSVGEDVFNRTYLAYHSNEDVIILGSSRGNHHYNPQILQDSLKMSCFNASYDGLGILSMYGRYKLIARRKAPKIVVFDVFAPNEIYGMPNEDYARYIDKLRPYTHIKEIKSYLVGIDPMEKYKTLSKLYCYNSKAIEIVSVYITRPSKIEKGFYALEGEVSYAPKTYVPLNKTMKPDSVRLNYMRSFIHEARAKGTKVVLAISPYYGAKNAEDYSPIIALAMQEKVPLLNHFADKRFVFTKKYFKDSAHLNATGAKLYTEIIAKEVKALFAQK